MVMTHNETKKKKQGDESGSRTVNTDHHPLIMEQKNSPRCPIASFEKYLARVDHS